MKIPGWIDVAHVGSHHGWKPFVAWLHWEIIFRAFERLGVSDIEYSSIIHSLAMNAVSRTPYMILCNHHQPSRWPGPRARQESGSGPLEAPVVRPDAWSAGRVPPAPATLPCAAPVAWTIVDSTAGVGMGLLPPPYSGQTRVRNSNKCPATSPWACKIMFMTPPGKSRLMRIMA